MFLYDKPEDIAYCHNSPTHRSRGSSSSDTPTWNHGKSGGFTATRWLDSTMTGVGPPIYVVLRATQGHSVSLDRTVVQKVIREAKELPSFAVHGTTYAAWQSIKIHDLFPGGRRAPLMRTGKLNFSCVTEQASCFRMMCSSQSVCQSHLINHWQVCGQELKFLFSWIFTSYSFTTQVL